MFLHQLAAYALSPIETSFWSLATSPARRRAAHIGRERVYLIQGCSLCNVSYLIIFLKQRKLQGLNCRHGATR